MKIYKVGGCVRDELMGKEARDIDWLVVGATPQQMVALGYKQVGADFPVFLHPVTKEEYALARIERKMGLGHKGFETSFDSTVTIEEDLSRRDLTINAMAQDVETGEIIDPFGGRQDLANGVLRHVSEAFSEDPLRVLRLARFQARTGFSIHPDTAELCADLCADGSLRELSTERVCAELRKLLECEMPEKGMESLAAFGALESLDPQWTARMRAPQLAALGSAAQHGLPEWAKTRLSCCSGLGPEDSGKMLEHLRFPGEIVKWSVRMGGFCSWARQALDSEPTDWTATCFALERAGAPKLTPAEREDFKACARLELESWGASPALAARAMAALDAAQAIASADLSAALAGPKPDLPAAVKKAKAQALSEAWAGSAPPSAKRPKA